MLTLSEWDGRPEQQFSIVNDKMVTQGGSAKGKCVEVMKASVIRPYDFDY